MFQTPILSAWIVIPLAIVVMLFIAGHIFAIHTVPMPPSMRRIRTANGLVMLGLTPLLAFGLCMSRPDNQKLFVVVWLLIIGLVAIVLLMAGLDMVNNLRLYSHSRRQLSRESAQRAAEAALTDAATKAKPLPNHSA